jgi:hypothetical protein
LKEWSIAQMRDNYEDFEKLLTAKYAELRAMIDSL